MMQDLFKVKDKSNIFPCRLNLLVSAKCRESRFNPNVNNEVANYPNAKLARQGVIRYILFDIGKSLLPSQLNFV